MKKRLLFSLLFLLTAAGCQDPAPIEVTDGTDDSALISITNISSDAESEFGLTDIDTMGMPGGPSDRFFGRLLLSDVRFGFPVRAESLRCAEALFLNRERKIQANGKTLAYGSIDAGTIRLGWDTLLQYQRRIRQAYSSADTMIGPAYRLRNRFENRQEEEWSGSGSAEMARFTIRTQYAPGMWVDDVTPPFLRAGEPLTLRWRCENPEVMITVSRQGDFMQRRWIPLLQLRIQNTKQGVTIPAKVLDMLPLRSNERLMLTISSEIRTATRLNGYPDSVLVRSASIHNIVLTSLP